MHCRPLRSPAAAAAAVAFAMALAVAACSAPKPVGPTLAQLQAMQLPNAALPAPNLITGGQPTAAQLAQLVQLGVRRVICLRSATEQGTGWEEEQAKALGIEFVRVPVAGAADVTIANAKRLAAALGGGDVPTFVCCANSNRVGALLALKAFHVDGKSADEALALGKAAGLAKLESKVVEQLQ
jgi:uncharacterized protein (TIGR01244 family)